MRRAELGNEAENIGEECLMRRFGVEEELLLVDATTLEPLPAAERLVALQEGSTATGHEVTVELKQEQIEVTSPPQTTLAGQLEAIRTGRAVAEAAAATVGGRVVALPTAPGIISPHLVPAARYRKIAEHFGITAAEQLTNGFHVHVEVSSHEEAVAVLDRIRIWLPALLALSANSPFWHGVETGYASYRYQVWSRWPTSGPTEIFGSPEAYAQHRQALLDTQVPLDPGMLYFDARLCEHQSTVEVRIADVCLDPFHAAVIAVLVRALVEIAARQSHDKAPEVPASVLRIWGWQASRCGVEERLIDPETGEPAPAGDVITQLLDTVRPALIEYGEEEEVESVVADILRRGSGARHQRQAYAVRHEVYDVVAAALQTTHSMGLASENAMPIGTDAGTTEDSHSST